MKYTSLLVLLFLFGCKDDSRLSEKRGSFLCKKFYFEAEVSDWMLVRNKVHEIAIKHDYSFVDDSIINFIHPHLRLEVSPEYPTSNPPYNSFRLGSLSYLGKKTEVNLYHFTARKDLCKTGGKIYSEIRDAMKGHWEITEDLVVKKLR